MHCTYISLFNNFSFCLQCTTITGQQCSQVPTQTCTTVYESVCDNSVGSLVNTLGRRGRREAEDETEEEEREARQLDIPANRGRTFGNIGLNANLGGGLGVGGGRGGGRYSSDGPLTVIYRERGLQNPLSRRILKSLA